MFSANNPSKPTASGLAAAVLLAVALIAAHPASAQTETVLYTFHGQQDGRNPLAGLSMDSSGNLYGTTSIGVNGESGLVFELSPSGQQTVLLDLSGNGGGQPFGGVVRDAQGNLYGTTENGGRHISGTLFEVTAPNVAKTLHLFRTGPPSFKREVSAKDGTYPAAGPVMDAAGNLYGTTQYGGQFGCGTVYKQHGNTYSILYNFDNTHGCWPLASLILDAQGNLYGTTSGGGDHRVGTVFKVSPDGTPTLLYSFTGSNGDGYGPASSLVRDAQGNLYGTTVNGGSGYGTVFKVTPGGAETVLYTFKGGLGGPDGVNPVGGLVMDSQGNLFGTTEFGGAHPENCGGTLGCGTIFKIAPNGTETVLYRFTGKTDGAFPVANLLLDAQGNLYGTTEFGGDSSCNGGGGCGVVFRLTP